MKQVSELGETSGVHGEQTFMDDEANNTMDVQKPILGRFATACSGGGKPKITLQEYRRIAQVLTSRLAPEEDAGVIVKEEDLVAWYMEETLEENILHEEQFVRHQRLLELIINRMIIKDRVILVHRASENVLRPEERVLVKNPEYPVEERVPEMAAPRAPRPRDRKDTMHEETRYQFEDSKELGADDLARRSMAAFGGVEELFGGAK